MRNFLALALTLFITTALGAAVVAQNSNTPSNNTNAPVNRKKVTNTNKSANSNKSANVNKSSNANSSTGSQAINANTSSAGRHRIIDINTASKQELMTLSGIGEAYSQKIIEGRPYKSKDELVRRGIITQALYSSISARIIAHQVKTKP